MSDPAPSRLALLDSDLLASRSVRLFLGLIAENGNVGIGATARVLQDAENAARDILDRFRSTTRPVAGRPRSQADPRAATRSLNAWVQHYRRVGLWFDWSRADWTARMTTADIDLVLHDEWISRRTDPEDEHVAAAAIMGELHALCTANRNMIDRRDWLDLMNVLDLPNPPELCRRERIIDFLSNEPGAWRRPQWTIDKVVAVMRPSGNLRTPILNWARRIQAAFPDLSRLLDTWMERVSEPELQERYWQAQGLDPLPVTREFVETEAPAPG